MESIGKIKSNNKKLNEYLRFWELSQISILKSPDTKFEMLKDILNSIIYKDIIGRINIKNKNLLNKLIEYIIINTSEILSVKSIINYLKNIRIKTKPNTIYEYLQHINNSMLIYECKKVI